MTEIINNEKLKLYWKKYLNRIKLMNGNIKDIILNGVVNINE